MDEPDITDLARLHRRCLTDSLVTAMGEAYVRSFYRYVTRSDREFVVVERGVVAGSGAGPVGTGSSDTGHGGSGHGDTARIVAAAVVSLQPANFYRRLLLHTSLVPSLIRHSGALLAAWWAPHHPSPVIAAASPARVPAGMPEMILIFTAPDQRGTGRGSALLRQVESGLRARAVRAYQVRTELDPSNRALEFYRTRGFVPLGVSTRLGTPFQVFLRSL